MSAAAASTASLSLLVPASLLPGEGEDLVFISLNEPATSSPALFRVFQNFAAPRASRFVLDGSDVHFDGELHEENTLQLVQLSRDEETGDPQIEVRPAMSYFDWAGVKEEVARALDNEHFLGTPEEMARVFTSAVREVAAIAALGFSGEAVPLLKVKSYPEDRSVAVSFLGIWLAQGRELEEIRSSLPAHAWQDGAEMDQSHCILLDAADVEGRGLKEAVLSAAMLALVFGGAAQAEEPVSVGRPTPSRFASFFNRDSKPGEVLPVKTQKLVQEAPRIYREALEREGSDLRVIISIATQRAYLVKDGQVAFETPISTGRGPRMTTRGTFKITEKVRQGKISTIYKCPLPGWMRIGEMPIGMHEGQLPGYPASHGCVRMPLESALFIFDHAPVGTTVQIIDSWSPAPAGEGQLVAGN